MRYIMHTSVVYYAIEPCFVYGRTGISFNASTELDRKDSLRPPR